jgi:ADP-ribose pyrophosphatase YjhB (NUDIX family)
VQVDVTATLAARTEADAEGCCLEWCLARTGEINSAGDVVVLSDQPGRGLCALMISRSIPPFTAVWALPGGMQEPGETLEQTSDREMQEEVGIDASAALSRHVLGEPIDSTTWDPRFVGARVSAILYEVPAGMTFVAGDDALAARWIPIDDLASGAQVIAFEQASFLARAFDRSSPRRDDDLCERERSRALIVRVNELRDDAGYQRIPV